MKTAALIVVATLALALPAALPATNPKHHKHPRHHHPKPPVVVAPPVVVPPVVVRQPSATSYCLTSNRGVTYVQLTEGALDPGTHWRNLYDTGATVTIAGQTVTFINKGDAGITKAFLVPGIGSTC